MSSSAKTPSWSRQAQTPRLSPALLEMAADAVRDADVLICQLEIPMETVQAALQMARSAHVRTILNPAPAQLLPDGLLPLVVGADAEPN